MRKGELKQRDISLLDSHTHTYTLTHSHTQKHRKEREQKKSILNEIK